MSFVIRTFGHVRLQTGWTWLLSSSSRVFIVLTPFAAPELFRAWQQYPARRGVASRPILLNLARSCGKRIEAASASEDAAELRRCRACHSTKHFCEMAGAGVADFESDFGEAVRGFSNELLSNNDPLAGDKLQR